MTKYYEDWGEFEERWSDIEKEEELNRRYDHYMEHYFEIEEIDEKEYLEQCNKEYDDYMKLNKIGDANNETKTNS
jgi:hypothetical protein